MALDIDLHFFTSTHAICSQWASSNNIYTRGSVYFRLLIAFEYISFGPQMELSQMERGQGQSQLSQTQINHTGGHPDHRSAVNQTKYRYMTYPHQQVPLNRNS